MLTIVYLNPDKTPKLKVKRLTKQQDLHARSLITLARLRAEDARAADRKYNKAQSTNPS